MNPVIELLSRQEKRFLEELRDIRCSFSSSDNIGADAEIGFRKFLRRHLPRSFSVAHGEVIDLNGGRTNQTDTVILSDEHPYVPDDDRPGMFVVEGVVAAVEIKAVLTTQHLKDALKKARRFRSLRRTSDEDYSAPGNALKYVNCPPYFLFAYTSQLTLETVLNSISAEQATLGVNEGTLDAVFVPGRGSLIDMGPGYGRGLIEIEGKQLSGFIKRSNSPAVLEMLAWLSAVTLIPSNRRSILVPYLSSGMQQGVTSFFELSVTPSTKAPRRSPKRKQPDPNEA